MILTLCLDYVFLVDDDSNVGQWNSDYTNQFTDISLNILLEITALRAVLSRIRFLVP